MKNLETSKTNPAILALIVASFLYATAGLFDRALSEFTSSYVQIFVRSILAVLMFSGLILVTRTKLIKPQRKHLKYFIAIGIFGFSGILFFIEAVTRLPIGFTLFVFYSGVLISGFSYGTFILKEKINRYELIALGLSILGLIIMFAEGAKSFDLLGMLFAFLAGCGFSLNLAVSKNISSTYSTYQISLTTFILVFLLSIPVLLINEGTDVNFNFGLEGWLIFFMYSVAIVIAYLLALFSYKHIEAQKASIILLAEILFAALNGFIFYKEIPTMTTIIGGTIIIIAQILVTKGEK